MAETVKGGKLPLESSREDKMDDESKAESAVTKTEMFIHNVGAFGRFQKLLMVVLQLEAIQGGLRGLFIVFALLQPDVHCNEQNTTNFTDNCDVIKNCANYSLTPKYGFESFMYDWPELMVQRCLTFNPVLMLMSVKEIVAGVVNFPIGMLPDILGRKPVIVVGFAIRIVGSLIAASSTNLTMFGVFYVVLSVGNMAGWTSIASYSNEVTLSKYRLTMTFSSTWVLSFATAALGAYIIRSWYGMIYASCVPSVILWLVFVVVIPESPRWLIVRQKYGRAAEALNRIAKINGADIRYTEDILREELEPFQPKEYRRKNKFKKAVIDLKHLLATVREVKIRKYLIFLLVYYLPVNAIGYNFLINAGELKFNTYVSIALVSAYRSWTPFFVIGMDLYHPKFSRRFFLLMSIIATSLPLLIAAPFAVADEVMQDSGAWMSLVVALCALLSTAMATGLLGYSVVQVNKEVIPTVSRSGFMALMAVLNTIGDAIGPQLILLQDIWPPLHYIVAAVAMGLAVILAYYFVPETKHMPLPDTYSEMRVVLKEKEAVFRD